MGRKTQSIVKGKTIRQLWIRISEHMRSIIKGKGSALAKHECKHGYDLQIIARAENRKETLRAMEGKMMSKYKPKINIKDEKKAREIAEKMGKALRDMEASDDRSDEFNAIVEREDENGDGMSEAEASKKVSGEPKIVFNAANYTLLAAIKAHQNNKPFTTTTLGSKDASDMGIEVRDRYSLEKFWYSTNIGILTDSSRTWGESLTAIWYSHPIGQIFDPSRTPAEKILSLGLTVSAVAVMLTIPFAAPATFATSAAGATSTAMVAKLGVKSVACGAAYMIPGIGQAAPIICAAA